MKGFYENSDFDEGMSDGGNGGRNKNIGSLTPNHAYEIGYREGLKIYLLNEKGIYKNYHYYTLIVESNENYPLSTPATYRLGLAY